VLQVLRETGFSLSSSCALGMCGSCECGYTAGAELHRDVVPEANARRNRMLLCWMSRAEGRVVLAL